MWNVRKKKWHKGGLSDELRRHGTDAIQLFGETIINGEILLDTDDQPCYEIIHAGLVLQSTGVFDVNGREIFEQDIVVQYLPMFSHLTTFKGVVKYDAERAKFVIMQQISDSLIIPQALCREIIDFKSKHGFKLRIVGHNLDTLYKPDNQPIRYGANK